MYLAMRNNLPGRSISDTFAIRALVRYICTLRNRSYTHIMSALTYILLLLTSDPSWHRSIYSTRSQRASFTLRRCRISEPTSLTSAGATKALFFSNSMLDPSPLSADSASPTLALVGSAGSTSSPSVLVGSASPSIVLVPEDACRRVEGRRREGGVIVAS